MGTAKRYSSEVRERAVRMVLEQQGEHGSRWAAVESIAGKLGCAAQTLQRWLAQAERDTGNRPGVTSSERERLKQLTLKTSIVTVLAKWRLRRAIQFWHRGADVDAIQLGLSAVKHLDSAKVVVAQWYGLKGDWKAAIPLLEQAAANGRWEAKQVLASCYLHGDGIPADPEKAYELAAEAAEAGSLDCQIELARYYSNGKLRSPNFFLAMKYARMAAVNGKPELADEVLELQTKSGE